jgi:DNA-binding FadR family transcriptional regulator
LFNVSRPVVRQAIHRLREVGLVRGGQGGTSIVLDPNASADPRIVALTMQLAPERTDEQDVAERQLLAGAMLLELAEHRMNEVFLEDLEILLAAVNGSSEYSVSVFERDWWMRVAHQTANRLIVREARWWFELTEDQPARRRRMYGGAELRLGLYRSLLERLKQRQGAARFYLDSVKPLFDRRPEDDS